MDTNKALMLLEQAKEVANNAYAPYSKFKVGASILFKDNSTVQGCNVENASYGLSLCAERNALSTAISVGKNKDDILAIAIYSPNTKKCFPCGACRQWIAEFSSEMKVIVEKDDNSALIYTINELLPHSFCLDT